MTEPRAPMTAAEYRAKAEEKRNAEKTYIVGLKSGTVFELRRPNLHVWSMTGRVPQSLLAAGVAAWRQQGKVVDDGARKADAQSGVDMAAFFVTLVQYCTVNPRLVEFPDPDKNEIGPNTMLDEDFFEIVGWAMNHEGVAGIAGLQSFREGRERGTPGDSADGAELQPEAIQSPAN